MDSEFPKGVSSKKQRSALSERHGSCGGAAASQHHRAGVRTDSEFAEAQLQSNDVNYRNQQGDVLLG